MKRRAFIAVGLGAVAAGGLWWRATDRQTPGAALADTADFADVDTSSITEMTMGAADAPVTVTEYASFTCPHCANFHATTFQSLKRDYIDTGKVRFVHRDVYFDGAGLRASMLARCAGPTRFFGIADLLYDRQKEWLDAQTMGDVMDNLHRIGKIAGLEEDRVTACIEDQEKAKVLTAWFRQHAEADGINSTPTVLVDGTAHGNPSYGELQGILDEKLSQ